MATPANNSNPANPTAPNYDNVDWSKVQAEINTYNSLTTAVQHLTNMHKDQK